MDGTPPPERRDTAEERSSGPHEAMPDERFGPLALRRMTKPDGRSLIVYERADRDPHDAPEEQGRRITRA